MPSARFLLRLVSPRSIRQAGILCRIKNNTNEQQRPTISALQAFHVGIIELTDRLALGLTPRGRRGVCVDFHPLPEGPGPVIEQRQ